MVDALPFVVSPLHSSVRSEHRGLRRRLGREQAFLAPFWCVFIVGGAFKYIFYVDPGGFMSQLDFCWHIFPYMGGGGG